MFRNVVRSHGYPCSDAYGEYNFGSHVVGDAILLHPEGDLAWSYIPKMSRHNYELSYEQVKALVESYSEERVRVLTNSSPETSNTVEKLAQRIQQLTSQRDQLNTELDRYKQLLIKN